MRRVAMTAFMVLVGCAPLDDGFGDAVPEPLDELSAAIAATTCPPTTEVCSGTGDVYTSLYRVGNAGAASSDVAQTFTVLASGVPDVVHLKGRLLRPLSSGENPLLRVRVVEAPGGVVSPAAATLASGQTGAAALSRVLPSEVAIPLSGTTPLVPGTTYAFLLTIDAPATGTALVGVASHKSDAYPGGTASMRWSPGGPFSTTPGAYDLSFALGTAPAAPADPLSGSVVLAMHFDGANGSTSFVDEKGHPVTASGVTLSTTKAKFGTASASFGGTGYLLLPNADFAALTGDWTFEGWIHPTAVVPSAFYAIWSNGYPQQLYLRNGNVEGYVSSSNGASYIASPLGPPGSVAANTWTHVAFVKNGNTYTVYVNGVAGTPVTTATAPATSNSPNAGVGAFAPAPTTYSFVGYIDDVRVTRAARYTGAFSVPTAPFPNP